MGYRMDSEKEKLCLNALGEDHGRIFIALWWETLNQAYFLKAHNDLFGDPALVSRLNNLAPTYFGNLQQLMMRDMIARICRLIDPATQRNGQIENLSLLQLESFFLPFDSEGLELRELLEELEQIACTLRTYRNKFGSHNDLPHVLGNAELSIPPHLGMIEQCTVRIEDIVNFVEGEFGLPITNFQERQQAFNDYATFRVFLERNLHSNSDNG